MITWPKVPKLSDVTAALDELDARVTANRSLIDGIIADQAARIDELEHFADEHRAGADERTRIIDQLRAEAERLAWKVRFKR